MHRRRKKYYGQYHSDYRLEKYFSPIINDLKKLFFSLPQEKLQIVLNGYKNKYGEKPYQYAIETYTSWRVGRTQMSQQTLLRLVETLPPFLTAKEKLELVEKVVNYHLDKNINKETVYISVTWDNFTSQLDEEIAKISRNRMNILQKVYARNDVPQEALNIAGWLVDNDSKLLETLIREIKTKKANIDIESAKSDLRRFKETLFVLEDTEAIYNSTNIEVELPTYKLRISIEKKKKPVTKILKNFFGL